jgi:feruloyl esterase
LQVVGNGGFAGTISYAQMATALRAGYAAASTDTGHTGPSSNTFVNEDVLVDFAHRAIHETTVAAKSTVNGFYGNAPTFSYFTGCSTGGRQALTAAQRYPEDFNGIVAGAPASHTSTQAFGQIWFSQALSDPAGALPREKLTLVHEAVLNACDALDGAKDGVLENPLACTFDPKVLACKDGADPASCLTAAQVTAVQKVYAGPSNPRTGNQVYVGLERGSEPGWSAVPVGYAVDYFKHIVFKDANWDPKALNYDAHVAQAATGDNLIFDATNADLGAFTRRGGKLIMYQGWGEPGIPPANLVKYYSEIQTKTADAKNSVRLFMVPGMGHCGGGTGVNTFDMAARLDRWVSTGQAPSQVPASRVRNGVSDRTRPLCAYPEIAIYKGSGSLEDGANFVCGTK